MHYPDPVTGQPAAEPAFAFQYTIDGLVAARSDARGMRFEHAYDELGRRIEATIDDSDRHPIPAPCTPGARPPDRISRKS
ncbi:MAG: hypothetical protein L6R00_21290 [Phycisphaerae bacterium]|nr:hypothetical protein [Phycisphaerae bacterium]